MITLADCVEAVEEKMREQGGMGHHEVAAEVAGGHDQIASWEPTRS